MSARPGPTFTIFGAGLAGALLAARLAQRGQAVRLFERRPDPRLAGAARGRSINLALSTRGLEALRAVGLAEKALELAIPMRGRMIHPPPGARGGVRPLVYQPYSPDGAQAIHSISRAGLNMLLLDAAERAGATIAFNTRCEDVDFVEREASVVNPATGEESTVRFETVIGADGAFSAVRSAMARLEGADYSQSNMAHGYKELTMPAAPDAGVSGSPSGGGHAMEKHALHIWPRRSHMLIALPNLDGSFTCTLFAPRTGEHGFDTVQTDEDAVRYFEARFPDALALMPNLAAEWRANPVGSLVTIKCWPWSVADQAVLVGDAAHAIVPFYGQGMNASFEDCVALAERIDGAASGGLTSGALARVYAEYAGARKPHADAIAALALENFVEMRDKVGTTAFLRHKRNEQRLARWFPRWCTPLYSMVSFSTIPYALAVERARAQDAAVRRIASFLAAIAVIGALAGALALLT